MGDATKKATAADVVEDNMRYMCEARPQRVHEADEKVDAAATALSWRSTPHGTTPALYVDVYEVKGCDVLIGTPASLLRQPAFAADYLCGVPAYLAHRLRERGFNVCVVRLAKTTYTLRASIVPLLAMYVQTPAPVV